MDIYDWIFNKARSLLDIPIYLGDSYFTYGSLLEIILFVAIAAAILGIITRR